MGRPKRVITPEGYLRCAHCLKPRHIRQFYQTITDTPWWTDPVNGTEYGKPQSWCIDCLKEAQSADRAEEARKKEIDKIRAEVNRLGPPKSQQDETTVTGVPPWEDDNE
jgi:hypothetical protein